MSALSDYAWIHFTEEEDLFMNNPNYPQGVTHKKQHEEFLQKLQEFKVELQTKDAKIVNKELLDYSIAWLTNHIRVTDRKMINCCISAEVLQNNASKKNVCVRQAHYVVQQKLTQHCRSTILS